LRIVRVNAQKPYDVLIGSDLLGDCGRLAGAAEGRKAAVITDDVVAGLYLGRVCASLEAAGCAVSRLILPNGEQTKTIANLGGILEFLAERQFTRGDLIIALGGGVIGDLAGFAASAYLRGTPFVQIPTTLLAQVDSSVGGKTAVNLAAGKNLAGAFYQPFAVICDTKTLSTLGADIYAQGMVEVIKYGAAFDKDLFESAAGGAHDIAEIVERCVRIKADIVGRDEFDRGERQLLNFGHTIGHAIERLSGFATPHGEAVGTGMVMIARAAYKLGFCEQDISGDIAGALERYNLPTACDYPADELAKACLIDKKRFEDTITLVVPERLGRCVLKKIGVDYLQKVVEAGAA